MQTAVSPYQDITTTGILKLFETDKSQRESFVSDLVQKIDSGYVSPLEVHLQIKCMEDIIKLLNSNSIYRDCLLTEAGKEGKVFLFHNAKFETKEMGVKYDFEKCGDTVLQELYRQKTVLDKQVKDRESLLKTLPEKGQGMINEETGETWTAYPPVKTSTTSIAVTLK